MQNNNNQVIDIPQIEPPQPFQVSEHINSKTYNIYLNEEIVEADKYSKLF